MALACSMASSKDVNGCSTTTGANTSSCQIEQVAGTSSRTVGVYRAPVTVLPHSSTAPWATAVSTLAWVAVAACWVIMGPTSVRSSSGSPTRSSSVRATKASRKRS
ncbi:hypothetical protein STSP_71980 [Streptomyces jeddahensis]|uniref:Uncharacterized protein n=1 Tax=Streptomyces jeddahensis TaxID=1716141 RepID=A0A177HH41_9ACTN|nr:hypothetical protein STSP_71980 [Streptomyces jeddahensis]